MALSHMLGCSTILCFFDLKLYIYPNKYYRTQKVICFSKKRIGPLQGFYPFLIPYDFDGWRRRVVSPRFHKLIYTNAFKALFDVKFHLAPILAPRQNCTKEPLFYHHKINHIPSNKLELNSISLEGICTGIFSL